MNGELVRYDAMCHAIAEAYSVDEVKDIRDRAAAMEHYNRLAHNTEAERQCCEIRLRAERKWRQLYDQGEKATGGWPSETRGNGHRLQDLGVTKAEAARSAKLAAIPDEEFERRLAEPGKLSAASVINGDGEKQQHPVDLVNEEALWLWGRIQDFQRESILDHDPKLICDTMLPHMRDTLRDLLPIVISWLREVSP